MNKSCQWNCSDGYCLSFEAEYNEHKCNYCKMETIKAKPLNEWISIKECKPRNRTLVLLSNCNDDWVVAGERVNRSYWNQFEYGNEAEAAIYPTHWQPLPAPPTLL